MTAASTRRSPLISISATTTAFVLLISVSLATVAMHRPVAFSVLAGVDTAVAGYTAATSERCHKLKEDPSASPQDRRQACGATPPGSTDQRPGILLALAALVLLSAAQYWWGPAWRVRRRRLRPLTGTAYDDIRPELERLAEEHLERGGRVRFLVDLLNPAVDGLAFGRVGRRYIVLSRGLLARYERDQGDDRRCFRTIVLHELAHVRNRDLDLTALTIAMSRSYLGLIIAPGLFSAALGVLVGEPPIASAVVGVNPGGGVPWLTGPAFSWLYGAQLLGLTVLFWLTRSAVLKTRELQADARALSWNGDHQALYGLLKNANHRRRTLGALRRISHPNPRVRIAALHDDGPLLRQGFSFSFAAGACLSLSLDPATSFTALARTHSFFWPAELFVLVLIAALAIRALRAAHTKTADTTADAISSRLGLALGLPTGAALAPSLMIDHAMTRPFPFMVQLSGLIGLFLAGWLLAFWVQWVMTIWEPRVRSAPERSIRALLAPLALVTAVTVLAARGLYFSQAYAITLYHDPNRPRQDPILLGPAALQTLLDIGLSVALPFVVILLLVIPLIVQARTHDRSKQHLKRPAHRYLVAPLVGIVAAWAASATWGALGAITDLTGPNSITDTLTFALAAGATVGATTTVLARGSPIAKSSVTALIACAPLAVPIVLLAPSYMPPCSSSAASSKAPSSRPLQSPPSPTCGGSSAVRCGQPRSRSNRQLPNAPKLPRDLTFHRRKPPGCAGSPSHHRRSIPDPRLLRPRRRAGRTRPPLPWPPRPVTSTEF